MERILLFIPMYNCEKQIVRVLAQLNDNVGKYISHIIIVNNRSTDNGEVAVQNYLEKNTIPIPVEILRNDENYGLGGSHKVAFDYAVKNGFAYVIVLHGDDQGDISNILPYLESKKYKAFDCFLGARFMRGSKLSGYSKFRTFGNRVYNILFSLGTGRVICDLGSGLNMYKTEILKSDFFLKFNDNLMFNYCMILASVFYKHNIAFFPIEWREDDQVSNVKMMSQAITVLKLLASYILNKKRFLEAEHRDIPREKYTAQTIFKTDGGI